MSEAISIAIIAICGYLIIIGAFKIIAPVANTTYIKMENMIADIQGMLDRKFPIEDKDLIESKDVS